MKKILFIVNPTAGRTRGKSHMFEAADWFRDKGCEVTALTTTKKGDAEAFVGEYAGANSAVVCCGGDGTLNEVITGMMKLEQRDRKPIGYLPAGTTNDMANTLHLPRNLKKAVRIVLGGNPLSQDVGCFGGSRYFTYIASFGAFTKTSYSTPQRLKNLFGHFAYVLDGLKNLGDIHPSRLRVEIDGKPLEGEFIFGSVSNSTSIGGVLKLKDSDIGLDDGKFEVLLIRNPQNMLEFQNLLHDLRRHRFSNPYVTFAHASRAAFHFDEPTDWTLDGEYAPGGTDTVIENLRGAVRLIRHEKPQISEETENPAKLIPQKFETEQKDDTGDRIHQNSFR